MKFKAPTPAFKEKLKELNFGKMFKENIIEFINKIVSKIIDILTISKIMELINLDLIKERKKEYYSLIKDKYELIFKNHI